MYIFEVVGIDMGVADEVGEAFRAVAGESCEEVEEEGALSDIERCPEEEVVAAEVNAKGEGFGLGVRKELIEEVAGGKGHLVDFSAVPGVEQDASAFGVVGDLVENVEHLVEGFIEEGSVMVGFWMFDESQFLVACLESGLDLFRA